MRVVALAFVGIPSSTKNTKSFFIELTHPQRLFLRVALSHVTSAAGPKSEQRLETEKEAILEQNSVQMSEEEIRMIENYLRDTSQFVSADSSVTPVDYGKPHFDDYRKVLGNPNSDVGMLAGGHLTTGVTNFLLDDILTLTNPEAGLGEKALAAGFILVKPAKIVDKGLDLSRVKRVDGGGKGIDNGYNYWNKTTHFKNMKVYQRDDIINPNMKDSRGRTNHERMKKGLVHLVQMESL
ncbi:hypothetical protein [Alkalihalobacterium chitinilyticum]|uniref:Pre-toxin TG domain-containing protein n=1 Tax=Alkalihalobacterium chitinilyticum TaxID=2980103 RepID=A0ABT5VFG8_9BACI|nr:hypothetical protein [Alkalihalobacterium chitinilyticum]MDE5414202.1 hypothetical protein [Alkalihalobacterium chitinilyticum]